MSRTRRVLDGVAFGWLQQGLVAIVGLWLTPFLLRYLGEREYGLWIVATQILAYVALADLGVVALLPREASYAIGRAGGLQRAVDLPIVVGQTFKLTLWQLPFVALLAAGVWLGLPDRWAELREPLLVVLGAFAVLFPLRIYQAALQGVQDLGFVARAGLIAWIAGTATSVALVVAGHGLLALAAGWLVTQVATMGLSAVRLHRRHPIARPSLTAPLGLGEARRRLGQGVWASVSQIAVALVNTADILILGFLLGPEAVVIYACTGKLVQVLRNPPLLILQTSSPALAELRHATDRAHLARVCGGLTLAVLLVSGAIGVVVLLVNRAFVAWWVGPHLYGGDLLTLLFVAAMTLRHWSTTVGYTLFAFGHERYLSLVTLADGLVLTAAAWLLVPRLGLVAGPLASLAGVALVGLPLNLRRMRRETGRSRIASTLGPWSWRAIALSTAAIWIAGRLPVGLLAVALASIMAGLLYSLAMVGVVSRSPLATYVRQPLQRYLPGTKDVTAHE